ncbi:DNA helicase [Actinomyces radicidentis]|uniref:DNA helicase n=1 Tax=Actinomyces radicidentis TaxID=111015 RepID=A0A0X8JDA7_ACTRD|nr:DNA helicase [Actinomyces radicidentis]AMD86775.1 DNA helicase [Actinomyces radicidentis]
MTPSLFSFGRKRRHSEPAPEESTGVDGLEEAITAQSGEAAEDVPQPAEDPEPEPEPVDPVDAALARWRSELVELGGVASLDDIHMLDGVVDLSAAHPSGLAQLYAGRPTHLTSLIREHSALSVARQSLREVAGRTDSLARQFGVAPVYLAIGVASWTETVVSEHGAAASSASAASSTTAASAASSASAPSAAPAASGSAGDFDAAEAELARATAALDASRASHPDASSTSRTAQPGVVRTVNVPVLLRPVRLSSATADAALTLDASIEVNPVLARALRRYGSTADVDAAARATLAGAGFSPRSALERVAALGREYLPGFEIHEQQVIGAFVHPGQALVEDLDEVWDRARASALVAAVAGDEEARAALDVDLGEPVRTDRAPSDERGAGDLDPAQLDAVEAVSTGASLLLDAPPGSEVAETLAAIAADAAASGRTVVHVPATSADGHAVAGALRDLGLGDLVLDLTEDGSWRRHVADAIKESLGVEPPELDVPAIVDMREELTATRDRVSRYVDALHRERAPWGVSVDDALERLAELTSDAHAARTRARVAPGRLERLDDAGMDRAHELLERAHELGVMTRAASTSPWNGVSVADVDEATDSLVRLQRLSDELLPAVIENAGYVAGATSLRRASTMGEWCEQLEMLDGVRESLDVFQPAVFERSAADMVIATASKQWREDRSVQMAASDRRHYAKAARDLVRPGRVVEDLHGELVKVQQRRETWRKHDPEGGWPTLPHGLDAMQATAQQTRELIDRLQPVLGTAPDAPVLMDLPLETLLERAGALADDDVTAQKLPRVNAVLTELDELGLSPLVADLASREAGADELDEELTFCWWSSVLAQALRTDPDLEGLDAAALSGTARRLAELDAEQSASLAGPVRHAYARRVRTAVEERKADARALYIALSREDGVPLRDILALHPIALTVKPIWIIPPTLVPQVLAPDALVDLAVLDASADVPVSRVVAAMVRASQVIVVGDLRRAKTGLAAELGSLLPSVTLPTGRNALDAEIAAFLATNGYEGVVDAVPAPPGTERLALSLVDGRGMPAPGQSAVETVGAEVDRVVDLVIEHALTHPELSLGVVALNARHADEIRRAAAAAVAGSPALEEFFATGISEPFTVVDLPEARSLRRDHVILAVGYAKTPHGRTIHSFGQVSERSGMVELVEALCASRGTTHVVSCLAAEDIDPERLHAPGARLLREVLARAAGEAPQAEAGSAEVPDRLTSDLVAALRRRDLLVVTGFGVEGGLRLPIAVGHPDYPGELLVAVLTDDADYVAEPSLRRRDRHWVERLEHRRWRVHRAFRASVFLDPEAEAAQIADLIDDELALRTVMAAQEIVELVPEDAEDPLTSASTASAEEVQPERATEPDGAAPVEFEPLVSSAVESGSEEADASAGSASDPEPDSTADESDDAASADSTAGDAVGAEDGAVDVAPAAVDEVASAEPTVSVDTAAASEEPDAGPDEETVTEAPAEESASDADPAEELPDRVHDEPVPFFQLPEADEATGIPAAEARAAARDVRPPIAQGLPLQAYTDDQLDDLLAWIRTDDVVRTEDEEVEELRRELALRRRGAGITAVLRNVVRRTR